MNPSIRRRLRPWTAALAATTAALIGITLTPSSSTAETSTRAKPDRVVIITHPDARSTWLREDEVNEALGSRDLPVRHIVSSGIHDAQEPIFVPGATTAPA